MVISLIMNASKLKTNKQKQISSEQSLVANYSRTKRKNRINGYGVIFQGKTMHGRQRTTEHSIHVRGFTLLFTLQYCKGCNAEFRDMGEGKRTAAQSRTALESIKLFKWAFPMKFKIFPSFDSTFLFILPPLENWDELQQTISFDLSSLAQRLTFLNLAS